MQYPLLSIRCCENTKIDRKDINVLPEILTSDVKIEPYIRPLAIWQKLLRMRDEYRMPKTEQNTRSKIDLPVGMRGDDLVHEGEKARRVIPDFHVHIEFDMSVFGL